MNSEHNIYISMKVSVLLPGNSANTVCLMSEKRKVARQQPGCETGWRQRQFAVAMQLVKSGQDSQWRTLMFIH